MSNDTDFMPTMNLRFEERKVDLHLGSHVLPHKLPRTILQQEWVSLTTREWRDVPCVKEIEVDGPDKAGS